MSGAAGIFGERARRGQRKPYELLLHYNGTAELLDPAGKTVWSSDSDEDWREESGGQEFISTDEQVDQVLDYLVDCELLTDAQADALEVTEESLDGTPAPPDESD